MPVNKSRISSVRMPRNASAPPAMDHARVCRAWAHGLRGAHDSASGRRFAGDAPGIRSYNSGVTTAKDRRLPSTQAQRHGVIRRDGARWLLAAGDRHARVGDVVGMRYLAELLTHPGQEISAVALASQGTTYLDETRHEVLDATARRAYRA